MLYYELLDRWMAETSLAIDLQSEVHWWHRLVTPQELTSNDTDELLRAFVVSNSEQSMAVPAWECWAQEVLSKCSTELNPDVRRTLEKIAAAHSCT